MKVGRMRTILLASTMLLMAGVAMADPAPGTTLPKLAGVIAGQANVTQTGPAALQVTQTTASATVNWTSFSVGSQAQVVFTDPTPQLSLFSNAVDFINVVNKTMNADIIPASLTFESQFDTAVAKEGVARGAGSS